MKYISYFYDYRSPVVLELIRELLNRESTAIITLDFLMVIAEREEDKESLSLIIRMRRENDERLKWTYYQYTRKLPEVDQITFERPDTFKDGIQSELSFQEERLRKLTDLLNKVNENYSAEIRNVVESEQWIEERLQNLLARS